jgi:hypothetical protein
MIVSPNELSDGVSLLTTTSPTTLVAIDPITIGGLALAVNDLAFLLAPLPALIAGIFSINQREKIQKEIATTESELTSIKARLASSNLQINVRY